MWAHHLGKRPHSGSIVVLSLLVDFPFAEIDSGSSLQENQCVLIDEKYIEMMGYRCLPPG